MQLVYLVGLDYDDRRQLESIINMTKYTLGLLYKTLGDIENSSTLLNQVKNRYTDIYGPDHEEVVRIEEIIGYDM